MEMLSIVWDFDPAIFRIGTFEVRYYGLMWAIALLLGGYLMSYFCRREHLPDKLSESAFLYIVLGTILGARIGHCLFYEPAYYLPRPWAILTEFRNGGLASHGASIGIIIGIWLTARKNHISVYWVMDRLGVIAPISGALIRLGNLFNSEIIGDETKLGWGFKFVRLYRDVPLEEIPARHPTQLYEALCYFLLFAVLMLFYRKPEVRERGGFLFGCSLLGIFVSRFFIEFIKVEQEAFERGMTLDMGQLLSIPFILLGGYCLWYSFKNHISIESAQLEERKKTEPSASMPKKTKKYRH